MVSRRVWSGVFLAGSVLAASSAAARSGATDGICERLRDDLAVVARAADVSSLDRQINEVSRQLGDLEQRLDRQGCGGSIIVIRGGEGDICGSLEHQHRTLAAGLYRLLDERDGRVAAHPATLRAALQEHGCLAGGDDESGYSQFRNRSGSAIIEVPRIESSIQPAALSIEPEPDDHFEASVAPAEPFDAPQASGEVITLEERLENREVRVVGPKFLPDQSEAIDLRSPVPTFFR